MNYKNQGIKINELASDSNINIIKIYNKEYNNNIICHPRAQRPGLALAGYTKYLNNNRLQIFGKTEIGFLNQLKDKEKESSLKKYLSLKVPAIIISESQEPDDILLKLTKSSKIPILVSSLKTSVLISRISNLLYKFFSESIKMNGVLMSIMGYGIFIVGNSGIGKSETALELINKGYHIVADDYIEFYLDSNDEPVGKAPERSKNWIEVRGLGIINISDIFGESAVLDECKVQLVIKLESWDKRKHYDRLGENNLYHNILGKEIPMFVLPVAPGRNVSTLIEIAVRYFISLKKGKKSFIKFLNEKDNNHD